MSRHEGVSCDNCMVNNFEENRFKCLICYDYDLCLKCHDMSISTTRHLASHPMQCIITRKEYGLYYAGENYTPETPPSFVCPFCGKLGFTEALLQEHVNKEHVDVHLQVVCPICAALPSGDPNLVTDDLSAHLAMEHRAPRDVDDPLVGGGRHIRRMFYPGRGMRSRNHRNMHFSGGPISATSSVTPPSSAIVNNNSATSSSAVATTAGRDSMDPIAELLSQLSGVRRSAQQLQQSVTTATQLHELQTQLQLERHRATEIRQQLECFPSKMQATSNASQSVNVHPSGGVIVSAKSTNKKSSALPSSDDDEDSRFLLSCLDDETLSPQEQEKQNEEDFNRNLFVQELFLSMLSEPSSQEPKNDDVIETSSREQATPIECPLMSSTPTQLTFKESTENIKEKDQKNLESEAPSKSTQDLSSENNNNDDTGVGISMCADTSTDNSPVLYSLSTVSEQERARATSGSSTAVTSRSAPVLASGDRRLIPEVPQWHYHGDEDKDSDDDKPPSPTPTMPRGLLLQGGGRSVLLGGSHAMRVGGGASSISEYNRDEVPTGGALSKHAR